MTLVPNRRWRIVARGVAYGWAAPNTVLGLCAGALALLAGGQVRRVAGTVEVALQRGASPRAEPWRFDAITLGHVVLGRNAEVLSALRPHEQAHVRQYERWGPFFLPAYALSSAWQWVRGGRAHADNHFERHARAEER